MNGCRRLDSETRLDAAGPPAADLPELGSDVRPSVVVPLSEPALPEDWPAGALRGEAAHEVIVAASERVPRPLADALRRRGCQVLQSEAPRGARLRHGAARASGSVLVFLHADCRLPIGWVASLAAALRSRRPWGAFALRFEDPSGRAVLPLVAWGANARTRLFGLPFGDQAPFATPAAYHAVGGHPAWTFLDDLELSRRLRRLAPPLVLAPAVTTSARRYLRGGRLRTIATNLAILTRFALGGDPLRLAQLYRRPA